MGTHSDFDGSRLIQALDTQRAGRELGWTMLADELWQQSAELNARLADDGLCPGTQFDCTPGRLTNLKTARLADMGLVMRITQWLGQPAARFIHAVEW